MLEQLALPGLAEGQAIERQHLLHIRIAPCLLAEGSAWDQATNLRVALRIVPVRQTRRFQAELALQTKATKGSWKAAAKALGCSVKTLQRDTEGY